MKKPIYEVIQYKSADGSTHSTREEAVQRNLYNSLLDAFKAAGAMQGDYRQIAWDLSKKNFDKFKEIINDV